MKYLITLLIVCFTVIASAQSNIISEEKLLMNDSIKLPGTLTYDSNIDKQPLVIFIHGSGGVDKNGNQIGLSNASYIKQLSEELNKSGIAFYRYHKRTAVMENMKFFMQGISLDDFVKDAKLAVDQFKNDERFSTTTLIGHSQGSLVAMLASNENVDSYISLAGPSESIDIAMVKQSRVQNGDSLATILKDHFTELRQNKKIENVDRSVSYLIPPINQKFFLSWIKYSPKEEIKKVKIPVLIINGTRDLQVFEEDAESLHKANPKSKLAIIKNLNHVLKNIDKDDDNLASYESPDYPISKELIRIITEFVKR